MAHIHSELTTGSNIKTAATEHIKDSRVKLISNRLHFQAYEMCLFSFAIEWNTNVALVSCVLEKVVQKRHHITGIHHGSSLSMYIIQYIHCCSYLYSNQSMDVCPHKPSFTTDFSVGVWFQFVCWALVGHRSVLSVHQKENICSTYDEHLMMFRKICGD